MKLHERQELWKTHGGEAVIAFNTKLQRKNLIKEAREFFAELPSLCEPLPQNANGRDFKVPEAHAMRGALYMHKLFLYNANDVVLELFEVLQQQGMLWDFHPHIERLVVVTARGCRVTDDEIEDRDLPAELKNLLYQV